MHKIQFRVLLKCSNTFSISGVFFSFLQVFHSPSIVICILRPVCISSLECIPPKLDLDSLILVHDSPLQRNSVVFVPNPCPSFVIISQIIHELFSLGVWALGLTGEREGSGAVIAFTKWFLHL